MFRIQPNINPIKFYRLENGIRQSELAESLGVSQSAVSQWEREISVPSPKHLQMLSDHSIIMSVNSYIVYLSRKGLL
jgi:transcriptional regulator with XRE-family HTH domain